MTNFIKPTALLVGACAIWVYAVKAIRKAFPDDISEASAGEFVPTAPDSDTKAIYLGRAPEGPHVSAVGSEEFIARVRKHVIEREIGHEIDDETANGERE